MDQDQKGKTVYGALTIFYKRTKEGLIFLVVKNAKTGNISFVGGAQEDGDVSLNVTAQRENFEEIGLRPDQYELSLVNVKHDFVFNINKKERAGQRGSYQIFVSDLTDVNPNILYTQELEDVKWMSAEEVARSLTFSDIVEVFKKTVEIINT